MTEIWYSLSLSVKSYNYLCASLKGLLGLEGTGANDLQNSTDGIVNLNENCFKGFQEVWRRWLDLRVEDASNQGRI